MQHIYHITTADAWRQAQQKGVYTAPSLQTEGFIHCSTRAQVLPVANAFYRDVPDLLLLTIAPDSLTASLKWEAPAHPNPDNTPVDSAADLFPHVYGDIAISAIVNVSPLCTDRTGTIIFCEDET